MAYTCFQSLSILLICFTCKYQKSTAVHSNPHCDNYKNIKLVVTEITSRIFRAKHINIVDNTAEVNTGCLSELIETVIGSNEPKTITIGNGIRQAGFHKRQDWEWLNVVLVNNKIFSNNTETTMKLLQPIRWRASKMFFRDYTIFWQGFLNPNSKSSNIINLPELEKLKFKVELVDGFELPPKLISHCFYCDDGESRTLQILEINLFAFLLTILQAEQLFPDFASNFGGRLLRVTGGLGIPLLMDFKQVDGIWYPYGGFMIDPIFFHMQEKMNFTMTTAVFRTFGSQLENGSFTGFVREIYDGRSDIGMAGQSYDRMKAVAFLDAIHIDSVSFATAIPEAGFQWHAIYKAFKWSTWVLILVTAFFAILPLYVWLLGRESSSRTNLAPLLNKANWIKGLDFLYRPILDQDLPSNLIPMANSGRQLLIFWLLWVLIINVAYKSKLTSLMVHPEKEDVPNSFDALVANHKYAIVLHHVGGALHKNIQSTPSDTFKRIGARLELQSSMYNCLRRAQRTKRSACISYIHNIIGEIYRNFTDSNEKSILRLAQTNVFMTAGSYMLPKDAVYREGMNKVVAWQIACGFSKYALDKAFKTPLDHGKSWARSRPDLYEWAIPDSVRKPLVLSNLKAPFLILLLGLVLGGLGSFAIEMLRIFRKPLTSQVVKLNLPKGK